MVKRNISQTMKYRLTLNIMNLLFLFRHQKTMESQKQVQEHQHRLLLYLQKKVIIHIPFQIFIVMKVNIFLILM